MVYSRGFLHVLFWRVDVFKVESGGTCGFTANAHVRVLSIQKLDLHFQVIQNLKKTIETIEMNRYIFIG